MLKSIGYIKPPWGTHCLTFPLYFFFFQEENLPCQYEATRFLVLFGSCASNIPLISRLLSTVSKTAVRSKATTRLRLPSFFFLRPLCILLVTILSAVVVEC